MYDVISALLIRIKSATNIRHQLQTASFGKALVTRFQRSIRRIQLLTQFRCLFCSSRPRSSDHLTLLSTHLSVLGTYRPYSTSLKGNHE